MNNLFRFVDLTANPMKITVLKNKSGILSGVVIPAEDLDELKSSLRNDSIFFKKLEKVLNDQNSIEDKTTIIFDSGLNALQVEEAAEKITDQLYADAFKKGVPVYYRDARTTGTRQFIRANPDGSEDLVTLESPGREYKLVKHMLPAGKGRWAHLISA